MTLRPTPTPMPEQPPFLDAPDQAYARMGAKPPGQGWLAFDTSMPQARRGGATRFVMAVWNSAAGSVDPEIPSDPPPGLSSPSELWYQVRKQAAGNRNIKRTALWNGVAIAQEHHLPMFGMLKDKESRRCSLQHVYRIDEVRYADDRTCMWLRLVPVPAQTVLVEVGAAPVGRRATGEPDASAGGEDGEDAPRVLVQSFSALFSDGDLPLGLDTYQRGFVWGPEKIRQLAQDLLDYQKLEDPKPSYYMGSVLLHSDEERELRFVIDGQQRLTALCVLHRRLTGALPEQCDLSYSPQSAQRIRAADRSFGDCTAGLRADVFERITFTVISVERPDQAFTFFDTQNNRGVQLHATDLLKAYHLRAINAAASERPAEVQKDCALRWEGLQQGSALLSHKDQRVQVLFSHLLWRARTWRGAHTPEARHDALLAQFQSPAWARGTAKGLRAMPLYQARANRRAVGMSLGPDGHPELHLPPLSLSPQPADLPFAIRQPVHDGAGFFLYADKYADLLERITLQPTGDVQVLLFRQVLEHLVQKSSLFLQEAFLLSGLVFADQFASERLGDFALWLEHALGVLRVQKQQVRQETAQKFFRNHTLNLLDVIAGAFHPEQVIGFLRELPDGAYESEAIDVAKGGVQSTYKIAVLRFFAQDPGSSLAHKRRWVEARTSPSADHA